MKRGIFIHEDNRRPSPRQLHVTELVAKGFKNREIAKKLGMSQHVFGIISASSTTSSV
jgi:DNA-binding NarL/FixJ family response regulator